MYTVVIGRGHVGNKKGARATESIDAKNFHFTRLKPTFSILHIYFYKTPYYFVYSIHLFNKIFIFFYCHLSYRPKTTHTATIIQPPNHHHQATQQPSHHPIQPNYHQ